MTAALVGSFLLTALVIELTPGPNMVWLALVSAAHGRITGLAATAGISLGLVIIAGLVAAGLGQMAYWSPWSFALLRYAGAGYLLWLAWDAWRSSNRPARPALAPQANLARYFRHGLVINLLNAKAGLFFIIVLPRFIDGGSPVLGQTLTLSALYVLLATAIHLAIVALSGQLHDWLMVPGRERRVRRIFAVLLAGIALWFLWSSGSEKP